jgi:DNA invertase Pin-like site-specific DNA recombinase
MAIATAQRRAIGIIRVSQVNGREGDSFASPGEQRDRIRAACEREKLRLVDMIEQLDVSGGKPLENLHSAVEAIETGHAHVVVAAYFDRLFRNLREQGDVVDRIERAGGQVLAVDVGQVTNGSAGQWLSGTMLGAVSEYQRRTAKERSGEAQARAVARGVLPYPNVPPGYLRGDDGRLQPDPALATAVANAFQLRADGATIAEVRDYLAANGVKRSYHGVESLLGSRVVLGEIHFGKLSNLHAHPAIIDADLWRRVQRVKVSRGRRAKSDRLLARLSVLRCGSCGARMVVGTAHNGEYALYRCPPTGDCKRRVTISAELVESAVVGAVRTALADVEGRASVEDNARTAEGALESAQAALDGALRAFSGLEDEQAARERLAELRDARDRAQEQVDHLGSHRSVVTINADRDWDRLSLDARRALIRAVVAEIRVAPGRGADRITIELVSE